MTKHDAIPFPLSDLPTHYLATLEDEERLDCTHISIRLVPLTLIRLVWMHSVASVLRLVGIKIAVFETKVGALDIACIKYQGKQFLGNDEETSTDEAPYDCLSLGELAKPWRVCDRCRVGCILYNHEAGRKGVCRGGPCR